MKVGIIGFANITYMPYLSNYTTELEHIGANYDLIYWDRKNIEEKTAGKVFVYKNNMDDASNKFIKIKKMYNFYKFCKKIIAKEDYDLIIILTTIPAILLGGVLRKNYRNKYILDIRDYTYEKYVIYRKILNNIVGNSKITVISSSAFLNFLPPNHNYTICHNLNLINKKDKKIRINKERNKEGAIRISYIGAISYYNEVIKLLSKIANDKRFIFAFYGEGIDEVKLREYCQANSINNVYFYGRYNEIQKEQFYKETDILFNAYGSDSQLVKHALSNKLYDAAWYKIPIIVNSGTAMQEMSNKLGYQINYQMDNLADNLYDWYNEIDWVELGVVADEIIKNAIHDNLKFKNQFNALISEGKEF
ncbi:MAG: hypothetical protein K6T94_17805 [Paenibacillus sp.]|nr:hypothetical protein [Paenibacillus sp.]